MGHIDNYDQLKPSIDKCYDSTINFIFNGATPEEIKFYTGNGNLKLVAQKLGYYLKSTCPDVIRVINEYVKPKTNENNYPTNFDQNSLKEVKNNLNSWSKRTVAFNAEIVKIIKTDEDKIFLKVKFSDDQTLWVGDMSHNTSWQPGNKIRFVGWFIPTDKSFNEEFNRDGYLVVSYGSVDLASNKLSMYPNSEILIREWANGKVPATRY